MTRAGDDPTRRDPRALARALALASPMIRRIYAPRARGVEHLDRVGPALLVGNHSGGTLAMIEPLVLATALSERVPVEGMPSLLLHEVMWHTPLARRLEALGAVRASRENAAALLDAGRPVLVYPGGDREPFRPFARRDRIELGDRRGYVELAITHGVPIVPVVTAGMHSGHVSLTDGRALAQRLPLAKRLRVGVLPVTLSFPFGLVPFVPPPYLPVSARVRIEVLAPIHFTRSGPEAAADRAYVEACHRTVAGAMQRALDHLARDRRQERREELHARIDAALDLVEEWTLAPREPSLVPPEPAALPRPLRRAA